MKHFYIIVSAIVLTNPEIGSGELYEIHFNVEGNNEDNIMPMLKYGKVMQFGPEINDGIDYNDPKFTTAYFWGLTSNYESGRLTLKKMERFMNRYGQ